MWFTLDKPIQIKTVTTTHHSRSGDSPSVNIAAGEYKTFNPDYIQSGVDCIWISEFTTAVYDNERWSQVRFVKELTAHLTRYERKAHEKYLFIQHKNMWYAVHRDLSGLEIPKVFNGKYNL